MTILLRVAIAVAVLVPTIIGFGVRHPALIFAAAVVAFGAGRLLAPLLAQRPAARAAVLAVSALSVVGTAAWRVAVMSGPVVDAFKNVDEVTSGMSGRHFRVRGYVVPGSVAPKHFTLSHGDKRMRVVDGGERPPELRDGMEVLAAGVLGDDGVFQADSVLTRCPTNYDRGSGEKPF